MKKFLITTLMIFGFSGLMFAQQAPAKATATKPEHKMKVVKKDEKASQKTEAKVVPMEKKEKAETKTVAAGPVKKDGTPDMRYKANKEKPAGPLKKNGTPDMRYKANKKS
jgi:hypothetical protein